jgi:hypothetical protein
VGEKVNNSTVNRKKGGERSMMALRIERKEYGR